MLVLELTTWSTSDVHVKVKVMSLYYIACQHIFSVEQEKISIICVRVGRKIARDHPLSSLGKDDLWDRFFSMSPSQSDRFIYSYLIKQYISR